MKDERLIAQRIVEGCEFDCNKVLIFCNKYILGMKIKIMIMKYQYLSLKMTQKSQWMALLEKLNINNYYKKGLKK